ncbi:hypothetical protein NQZ68_016150 [Dissostichus eleginoides]|nr:hypothetical protein NQZ68_016150 [Dissostichus eleginoides]
MNAWTEGSLALNLMRYVGGRKEDRVSAVPPITCEISEPGHCERGYCVPLMRNALALLLKEKASFGQEFGGISRSVGEIFSGDGKLKVFISLDSRRTSLP